ncbi:MAG: GTPase HflX [Acholeplasmatales bacterium]|jgi:GTP-binding protein HflX|nr:GTPase HflX [Acholeplasmatales bacterium]
MSKSIIVSVGNVKSVEFNNSIDELVNLCITVDVSCEMVITQNLKRVHPLFCCGYGKLLEIKSIIDSLNGEIDLVIFNQELSPKQIANIEQILQVTILDRTFIILQIFAKRARTKESIWEISLAQKKYMYPRLIGFDSGLSRQGGGSFNARGAGETKLELNRRKLKEEIASLEKKILSVKKEKDTSNKERQKNEIPVVSLVGYTNVGKSSLVNSIIKIVDKVGENTVESKDMLFTTLTTKSKLIKLNNNSKPFILVDTVGFIYDMPTILYDSFYTTIKDITDSKLIVLVESPSDLGISQYDECLKILKRIGADNIPRIRVMTKSDLKGDVTSLEHFNVSNVTMDGIKQLVEAIEFSI